MDRM